MLHTAFKVILAGAAFAGTTCFEIPTSYAFGDAKWCAVLGLGHASYWDCQYRRFEDCVPNVLAGNRGVCSLNPNPGRAPPERHRHHSGDCHDCGSR
jgi:hypothetical protein